MQGYVNGSSHGRKGGVALLGLFNKGTNHLPQALPPNAISLWIRFQPMNLEGTQIYSL